jgi:hypothetical protein
MTATASRLDISNPLCAQNLPETGIPNFLNSQHHAGWISEA